MKIDIELFNQAWKKMDSCALDMSALIVQQGDVKFKHLFGDKEDKVNIRSLCKPITCLCYGIAIDNGYFKDGLDELVFPYLKLSQNITNTNNVKYIQKWTVRTLLTLTIGFEKKMLDSKHLPTIEGQNYGDVVLNYPLNHAPGEYFIYSNAAMYLASVVFQNRMGMKLSEFANKYLFEPLGIDPVGWKESPQGYSMGCTGIEMYGEDLLKIGLTLLNGGIYNSTRIVSQKWVNEMLSPQVETPMMYDEKRVLPKYAYGLNMWICKDGIKYCDGTDGQYLILVPHKDMVVITQGYQKDMKPITVCLENILK